MKYFLENVIESVRELNNDSCWMKSNSLFICVMLLLSFDIVLLLFIWILLYLNSNFAPVPLKAHSRADLPIYP